MEAALPRSRAQAPKCCETHSSSEPLSGENHSAWPSALATVEPSRWRAAPHTGRVRTGKPCPQRVKFIWGLSSHTHMKTSFEYSWGCPGPHVNKQCMLGPDRDSLSWSRKGPCKLSSAGVIELVAHELNWLLCVRLLECFVLFWFSLSRVLNLGELR